MRTATFLLVLLPVFAQTQDQSPLDTAPEDSDGFQWASALSQSGIFLGVQHAGRMAQGKTRRELAGPFWSDYFESVSSIHTWNDGDSILTNYAGHPVMGAVAGYIQVFNDPRGRRLTFDLSSKQYWEKSPKGAGLVSGVQHAIRIRPVGRSVARQCWETPAHHGRMRFGGDSSWRTHLDASGGLCGPALGVQLGTRRKRQGAHLQDRP